jgi:hypothetical protein
MSCLIPRRYLMAAVPALGAMSWRELVEMPAAAATPAFRVDSTYDAFPSQDPSRVGQMVGVSHGNFDRVKELIAESPALAKANVDWGFGDWESALGAASHTGNRDIAEFLIEHGARPTLFSATMLGQLAVVRAFVEASPGVQGILGPHGFTLLTHARLGGEPAASVLAYLESLGDADVNAPIVDLADEARGTYIGAYELGPDDQLDVVLHERFGLQIRRNDGVARSLRYQGDDTFAPIGAPSVKIRFAVEGDRATAVTVFDPEVIATARRK